MAAFDVPPRRDPPGKVAKRQHARLPTALAQVGPWQGFELRLAEPTAVGFAKMQRSRLPCGQLRPMFAQANRWPVDGKRSSKGATRCDRCMGFSRSWRFSAWRARRPAVGRVGATMPVVQVVAATAGTRRRLVPLRRTALCPAAASSPRRVANTFGTATAKSEPGGSPAAAARARFVEAAITWAERRAAASSRAAPYPSTRQAPRPRSHRLSPLWRYRPRRSEAPARAGTRHERTPISATTTRMGRESGLVDRVCDGRAGEPARNSFWDNHFRHD